MALRAQARRGRRKAERQAKVREAAKLLDLEKYLDRKPKALSGGQRQRVAMGRAIVRQPAVFLMDEPLSNLDAKLRVETRANIAALQARLETTTLYVTHDQVEAMTMGHRVAVLKDGVLQQVDTPRELYDAPANVFVAEFIGSPAMNLRTGRARRGRGADRRARAPAGRGAVAAATAGGRTEVVVGMRPEWMEISPEPDRPVDGGRARRGTRRRRLRLRHRRRRGRGREAPGRPTARPGRPRASARSSHLTVTAEAEHVFDPTTGERI